MIKACMKTYPSRLPDYGLVLGFIEINAETTLFCIGN